MTAVLLLAALLVAVGLVGIVVPVLPGTALVLAGVLLWAVAEGGALAWGVLAAAAALLLLGAVVKYVVPGRRLQDAGVPSSSLWIGGLLGVVGFFVVPVVGVVLGFVLGVYLAETRRLGGGAAGRSTLHALRAVGLSIVIELAAAFAATLVWIAGVVAA